MTLQTPPRRIHEDTGLRHRPPAWIGWLLPTGFLALAIVLLVDVRGIEIPLAASTPVDAASLVVGPRREAMQDPAVIAVEGLSQTCSGCHQIFDSSRAAGAASSDRPLSYHQEIQLAHGLNDRCVNCHASEDLQMLTLRDGTLVPFAETPTLCAQCHGTVFRDWQRGTHGKTLGSWITHSKQQRRLSCNECHDPHSPKYPSYVPLPGPNTLRMSPRTPPAGHSAAGRQSPLQRWLHDAAAATSNHPTPMGAEP